VLQPITLDYSAVTGIIRKLQNVGATEWRVKLQRRTAVEETHEQEKEQKGIL